MKNERAGTFKRVFVTGASGFIGSALIDQLNEENLQILCLVNNSSINTGSSNIPIIRGDLTKFDWTILEDFKPDLIYHFARISGRTKKERQLAATKNANANKRLLRWLNNQPNPPLLVFGSGTLVYGDHGSASVDESAEIKPISFQREYFEGERPILQVYIQKELPIIIVRPPWIYGAGSWFEWFFWRHMQEKQAVPLYGDGQNFMSLIHIDDCAGLIQHIAKYGHAGHIYNISAHSPIRQQKFAELLQASYNLPIKKYSNIRLWWQFNREAREALTFSLKSGTMHQRFIDKYQLKYPDLEKGIQSILKRLKSPARF